jgi:adenylate kinase family enzyme
MRRIVVLGTSGSGKSTFARALSQRLGISHIELDALHWEPNWVEAPRPVFRQRIDAATRGDGWVVDGNYTGSVRDLIWPRADTIIWLDYSMTITSLRVIRRTFRRWWSAELLWGNNRERLRDQFLSKDSLFLWVVQSWRKHRRDYPRLLRVEADAGKQILRFRGPGHAERWLFSDTSCESMALAMK